MAKKPTQRKSKPRAKASRKTGRSRGKKKKAGRSVGPKSRRKKASGKSPRRAAARRPKKKARRGTARKKPPRKITDPRVVLAMKQYDEAVRLFNRQSYRRAADLFKKITGSVSRELAERARVHLAICEQRVRNDSQLRLRSADDHYNFSVAQINLGRLDEARTHLLKALKLTPKGDHIHYALATVAALSNEQGEALNYLERAIELRPENRFQARHDDDLEILHGDLSFQQLVFPERFPTAADL